MQSGTPEEAATPPQSRSRQERIRDNQRRSRARRQEYLVDLEKRLSECQITCRDADIQKAALIELQIENTRLRELLSLAGVNDQFVDHYVSQAVSQASQFPQGANPALRQLKPKIAGVDASRLMTSGGSSSGNTQAITTPDTPRTSPPMMTPIASNMNIPDQATASTPSSSYPSVSSFIPPPLDMNAQTDFDWLYQQSPIPQAQNLSDSFVCEPFNMVASCANRTLDGDAILCSVAKQMIDHYHIPSTEMEQIKDKLSKGCFQPSFPGAGCTVDNQILFQVLNELSLRYS